ncbi:methyltransferase domain-containing protein [uncultured Faecalicoccus sp.]|uniref:methyltransferase domain-containing protein n=1 Tax=uncultured Faecalicoccus sp. TaxID=1971760 RepID=UPI0025D716DB|nr:methyltransferase domain-containing protein [uncultured Faecalicoccus sp.]
MLLCPVCKEPLILQNHQFVCKNHHTYDQAKEGYVNLSLKQKKMTGDNPAMVRARTAFLEQGYYDFLRDAIKKIIQDLSVSTLLDAGCGQGYYTKAFAGCTDTTYGVDLSKAAIQYAAKHDKQSNYIVSSIYDCPFANHSFDLITSIFTPDAKEEFDRLLKPGGFLIQVGPGPYHCFELKSILYETAYLNPELSTLRSGFTCIDIQNIKKELLVTDLHSLLEMTPYRYRTKTKDLEKIDSYSYLNVTFDFMIHIWRKL